MRDSDGHGALRLTESDICSLTVCSLVTLPVKVEKSEERVRQLSCRLTFSLFSIFICSFRLLDVRLISVLARMGSDSYDFITWNTIKDFFQGRSLFILP